MAIADTLNGRIGLTVYTILISFANCLVIFIYIINRRLRTLANRFVIALAVSDLLVSLIFMPLMTWVPNNPAVGPMSAFVLLASLGNICGCTYDRYNAIKSPLHYPTIMTKVRFIQVMVLVWLIPLVIALIPQIWMRNAEALSLTPLDLFKYEQNFVAFMTVLVLVICACLIATYIYIFTVAKRHYKAIRKSESTRPKDVPESTKPKKGRRGTIKDKESVRNFFLAIKSTALFATIGVNFLCCWLPLIIVNLAFAFDFYMSLPQPFYNASEILMYSNSLLNPITYAFFQKEFRRTILKLLRNPTSVTPSEFSTQLVVLPEA